MIVDKLGFYKNKRGDTVEIIKLFDDPLNKYAAIILFDGKESRCDWVCKIDRHGMDIHGDEELNLVEYLGPEKQKELRKFECEGYIGEVDNTILEEKNSYWHKDAIEDNLKKRCTNIFSKNIFLDTSIWTEEDSKRFPYTKISKWKITLEELPIEGDE